MQRVRRLPALLGDPVARVVPFVEALARTWRSVNPDGTLWWSPWELSAGQIERCVSVLEPVGLGLDLHTAIGETIATLNAEVWLRNTCMIAHESGIPALAETFLGSATEELEPHEMTPTPHLVEEQPSRLVAVPGVTSVREYYGLDPS